MAARGLARSYPACVFYLAAVITCNTHVCSGWQGVVLAPALGIPKKDHGEAILTGYVYAVLSAMVYASFLVHTHPFTISSCPPPCGDSPGCEKVILRDTYRMEFELSQSLDWCLFYSAVMFICSTRLCLDW